MNIEKSLDIIKGKLLMIKKLLKNDEENGHSNSYEIQEEDFEAIETLLTAYEKEKENNKELEKENKKLNLVRLQYLVSSFPDTTETYKKYKKELDELLKEE